MFHISSKFISHRPPFWILKIPRRCDAGRAEEQITTTSPVEILPWKREEVDLFCPLAMKQREFPLWIKNKEYADCSSPTNTFMGNARARHLNHLVNRNVERWIFNTRLVLSSCF
jgi:hypothetical protein